VTDHQTSTTGTAQQQTADTPEGIVPTSSVQTSVKIEGQEGNSQVVLDQAIGGQVTEGQGHGGGPIETDSQQGEVGVVENGGDLGTPSVTVEDEPGLTLLRNVDAKGQVVYTAVCNVGPGSEGEKSLGNMDAKALLEKLLSKGNYQQLASRVNLLSSPQCSASPQTVQGTNASQVRSGLVTKCVAGQPQIQIVTGQQQTQIATCQTQTQSATGQTQTRITSGQVQTQMTTGPTQTRITAGQTQTQSGIGQSQIPITTGQVLTRSTPGQALTQSATGQQQTQIPSGQAQTQSTSGRLVAIPPNSLPPHIINTYFNQGKISKEDLVKLIKSHQTAGGLKTQLSNSQQLPAQKLVPVQQATSPVAKSQQVLNPIVLSAGTGQKIGAVSVVRQSAAGSPLAQLIQSKAGQGVVVSVTSTSAVGSPQSSTGSSQVKLLSVASSVKQTATAASNER
jgi:hypothetical protein